MTDTHAPLGDRAREARALAIVAELLDLPDAERPAAVDAACGDDAPLRARVTALLAVDASDTATDPFADEAPWIGAELAGGPGDAPDEAPLPASIAGFRILGSLGAGGMGVVYEAEQDQPRRRVALKLMSGLQQDPGRRKRFAREQEALARLRHPGIATILESGHTLVPQGEVPWFAMELVDGPSITAHAAEHGLGVPARLALLADLADAVHHAHEHGIVHRDLKPDNVLVDGQGRVKVLDFGVARIHDPSTVLATLVTETGMLVGTLAYMAPEQVAGDVQAIGPATDVYALGVIAFELLSGRRPHELSGLPIQAAARLVAERDAPRLGQLDRGLRGDIETIVGKALEKEPERRYASAAMLGADLRRVLTHEPITARPPTLTYRMARFSRRHRGLVAAGVALVVFAALAVMAALDADRQARLAERQAYRNTLVAASLMSQAGAGMRQQLEETPEELRGWEWHHLRARLEPRYRLLQGGPGIPVQLAVSHAGRHVAQVRESPEWWQGEHVVVVFDVDSGERQVVAREGVALTGVAFRPGDRELAVVGRTWDGSQQHWVGSYDLETRHWTESWSPGEFEDRFHHGWNAISSDGSWALLHQPELTALHLGTRRAYPQERHVTLDDLAFLDGASLWIEARVQVRDLPDGAVRVDGGSFEPIRGVPGVIIGPPDMSPERALVDLGGDQPVTRLRMNDVQRATSLPDWSRLAVASFSDDVTVRDGRDGQELASLGTIACKHLAFLPDGQTLVGSVFESDRLAVWDRVHDDPGQLRGHESYVYAVACLPDVALLATGGWDDTVRFWDLDSGAPVASVSTGWRNAIWDLSVPVTGTRLVAGHKGGWTWFDLATGGVRHHRGEQVKSVSPSPDGERLAVFQGRRLTLVDARDGRSHAATDAHDDFNPLDRRLMVAWHPDGTRLYHTTGHTVVERSTADLTVMREYALGTQGTDEMPWQIEVLPSGDALMVVGRDVCFLDLSGRGERPPLLHDEAVLGARLSPDGQRLVTGGYSNDVHVWDLASGRELVRLPGHGSYVKGLAWSPDGQTLFSGSGDTTVRVWSTRPLRERSRALADWHRVADRLRPEVERRFAEEVAAGRVADVPIAERVADLGESDRERQIAAQLLLGLRLETAAGG